MVRDWPINCPRFMEGLRDIRMDCVSQLQYIRLDHYLLTALVERWSPQTNTFHFPVGEMTITLQDVGMILGIQLDGPPLVGRVVVGEGKRWHSWPDCCDDLIGNHPIEDVVYHDPIDPHISSTFKMGQAHAKTCMPLRWLRWTFYRDSYLDLTEIDFRRHLRAYILFMLGCFLLPDTSGSEVHLQYLPLLEDLELFSSYSLGGAVLAHLYRELNEATNPRRVNMGGCLHLLQIWSWERIHVGRPTLHVPYPRELDGLSLGFRWNEHRVREMPIGNLKIYRDEIDRLLQNQVAWEPYTNQIRIRVAYICLSGEEIWRARVPLISWKRVEWHLPDRVIRQFGSLPLIDITPMDPAFRRVDGRGKADVDWVDYHQTYIALWENRKAYIVAGDVRNEDRDTALRRYMKWYRSWASLYLLSTPIQPPDTYYSRAPGERALHDHFLDSEKIFQPFYGRNEDTPIQHAVDRFEELCSIMRRRMHISDTRSQDVTEEDPSFDASSVAAPDASTMGARSSTYADPGPFTYQWNYPQQYPTREHGFSQYQQWPTFDSRQSGSEVGQYPQQQTPFTPYPFFHGGAFMMPAGPMFPMPYYPAYSWGASPMIPHPLPKEVAQEDVKAALPHQLRDRPLRAPEHHTPGSDVIPRKRRRKQ